MNKEQSQPSYEINYNDLQLQTYFHRGYRAFNIDTVKGWLKDHNTYNEELRNVSRVLYNSNGVYTNVVDYMVSLPTLDRVVFSRDSSHSRYKKARKKYLEALRKVKEKNTVRDKLFKMATEGTAFYYFDVSEPNSMPNYLSDVDVEEMTEINAMDFNCAIVPLPTDYCRIVGFKNSSYIVAFDCMYFDQFTSNGRSKKLRRYPKEIRDAYRSYKQDRNKRWAVLNNDKTMAYKVRAKLEDKWGRPIGMAAFVDMLYDEYFTESKRNVLDEVNTTVIYQTFPEGKEKGTSALTQDQQKAQHDNIKSALFAKGLQQGINFFSVAAGTSIEKLKANLDLLNVNNQDELIKRISASLGFSASMLNGDGGSVSSEKSNIQLISAEIFSWLEQIEEEFNKVINANLIQDRQNYIEVKYLPITHANRDDQVKHLKDLYTHGSGSLQAWIAATGINPDVYLSLMDEEYNANFDQKYPPHPISFTQNGSDSEDQKPVDNDTDNPNTMKNKDTGANPIE